MHLNELMLQLADHQPDRKCGEIFLWILNMIHKKPETTNHHFITWMFKDLPGIYMLFWISTACLSFSLCKYCQFIVFKVLTLPAAPHTCYDVITHSIIILLKCLTNFSRPQCGNNIYQVDLSSARPGHAGYPAVASGYSNVSQMRQTIRAASTCQPSQPSSKQSEIFS